MSWISMDATGIARSLLLLPTDVAVNEMPIIPTAWTLPYEVVFYIAALAFITHHKKIFYGLVGCWIVLIGLVGVCGNHGNLLIDFITSTLFLEFFIGMIVAKKCMRQKIERRNWVLIPITAVVIGFALLIFSWIGTNIELPLVLGLDRVIKFGIPFAMIVYGLVSLELGIRADEREEQNGDVKHGNMIKDIWRLLAASSYSLYLIHYPLLLVLRKIGEAVHLHHMVTFIISATVCIIAGIIGYVVIEKALTKWISEKWGGERSSFVSVTLASTTTAIVFMALLNPQMVVNKKLVGAFIGDSITEQGYYLRALEENYPIRAYNYGVSGATYGECGSDIPLMYEISNSIDVTPDFIFVAGGTNDWDNGTVLGQRGDKTSDTFYGGVDILFSNLRERYPETKIVVSTILQRNWTPSEEYPQSAGMDDNGYGLSVEDYNDAIIWSANRYGCKVIDAYGESGITEGNILLYTKDGVHLNEKGGMKYADYIMNEIQTYIQRK